VAKVAVMSRDRIIGVTTLSCNISDDDMIDLDELLRNCGILKQHEEICIVDDLDADQDEY
jgi:hypothetical protein